MCVTGNSTTLIYRVPSQYDVDEGTETGPANVVSIGTIHEITGFSEGTIEIINDSDLTTTDFEQICPADLKTIDAFTVTVRLDETVCPPRVGVLGDFTLTLPGGSQWFGTGFVTGSSLGDIQNNVPIRREITIQLDGRDGPAFFPIGDTPPECDNHTNTARPSVP